MQMAINNSAFSPFWVEDARWRWEVRGMVGRAEACCMCQDTASNRGESGGNQHDPTEFLYRYNYLFWACGIFLACLPEEIKLI